MEHALGEASMKPSSIGGPGARNLPRSGLALARAEDVFALGHAERMGQCRTTMREVAALVSSSTTPRERRGRARVTSAVCERATDA